MLFSINFRLFFRRHLLVLGRWTTIWRPLESCAGRIAQNTHKRLLHGQIAKYCFHLHYYSARHKEVQTPFTVNMVGSNIRRSFGESWTGDMVICLRHPTRTYILFRAVFVDQ